MQTSQTSHIFHNGCMALTLLCFLVACETIIQMVGKFKIKNFRYQLINLMFISFSKR